MCLYSHAINKRQSHKSTTVPEKCLLVCLSLLFFPCLFLQTGFFEKKINTLPSGARSSLSTCSLWYVQVGFEMIIQVQGVWSGSYRPNQCLYKQKNTLSLSVISSVSKRGASNIWYSKASKYFQVILPCSISVFLLAIECYCCIQNSPDNCSQWYTAHW